MTRYTIIERYELSDLIEEVEVYLRAGWKAQGGVATIVTRSGTPQYLQALVM